MLKDKLIDILSQKRHNEHVAAYKAHTNLNLKERVHYDLC